MQTSIHFAVSLMVIYKNLIINMVCQCQKNHLRDLPTSMLPFKGLLEVSDINWKFL